jgi:nucleoside-diphosphate-sugar epimerase
MFLSGWTSTLATEPASVGQRHLLIFGQGFTGGRLAEACRRDGWKVTGTRREPAAGFQRFERCVPLPEEILVGVTHVVDSIPPDGLGDPVLDLHGADLALLPRLEWVGYLSTTGVYGDHDGAWVDETSETRPSSDRSKRRLAAENCWLSWGRQSHVPVQIFRLAGIYGPGRNALERVRSGKAVRVIKPGHSVGRIHVDDIVAVLRAAMANPSTGPIFNVADDEPAAQSDVLAYAADLLGVEPPPAVPFGEAELSAMARSFYADRRRVSNQRLKSELGIRLLYPTYREGLRALLCA